MINKHTQLNKTSSGFTLVELMIATAVFSVILLIIAVGFIQIGRIFHKGVSSARTQEVSRSVLESLSRDLQFSSGAVNCAQMPAASGVLCTASPQNGAICIGNNHYIYQLGTQSNSLGYVEASSGVPCGSVAATQQLLSDRMQLIDFRVDCTSGSGQVCRANVIVAQGDNDLMTRDLDLSDGSPRSATCVSNRAGGQFCSVSALGTSVIRRIR